MKSRFSYRSGSVQPRLLIAASLMATVGLIYAVNLQQGVSYASSLDASSPSAEASLDSTSSSPSSSSAPSPSSSSASSPVASSPTASSSTPASGGSVQPSASSTAQATSGGSTHPSSKPQTSTSPKKATAEPSSSVTPSAVASEPADPGIDTEEPDATTDPLVSAQQVVEAFQNTIVSHNQKTVLAALAPYLASGAISEQYVASQLAAAERVPHWPRYGDSRNIAIYLVQLVSVAVQKTVNVY